MAIYRFAPNRVWRVYKGGASIDILRGSENPQDGQYPEDWLASTVAALNGGINGPDEGLSTVIMPNGTTERFDRLLQREGADAFLPNHPAGNEPGFLAKLLDSAERLPIQAHPDVFTAQRLYHSTHGKTEAWIVLGGRVINGEEPYLLAGFNNRFDRDIFFDECHTGVMKQTPSMLHIWPIVPGETLLIPGGLPHAIGSGAFILEIMEPTDWVVQPETHCGSVEMSMASRFSGADPEEALSVFQCEVFTEKGIRSHMMQTSKELYRSAEAVLTQKVDREGVHFFGALELTLDGRWSLPETLRSYMTCVVLEGSVWLKDREEATHMTQGEAFAVTASSLPTFEGKARIALLLPPI